MDREELKNLALSNDIEEIVQLSLSPHIIHALLSEIGSTYQVSVQLAANLAAKRLRETLGIIPLDEDHQAFEQNVTRALRLVDVTFNAILNLATEYEDMLHNCKCDGCQARRMAEAAPEN